MQRKYKYTDQEFADTVMRCHSIAEILRSLGFENVAGGNYHTIKSKIKMMNLDTSHFTGKGWSTGKELSPRRNLEDYLKNRFKIKSHALKLRLIREGVFERRCSKCHLTEWMGQPISLELEHINGVHDDNTLDNLTLLCPNCHAQTPTYRGKNIGR